MLDTRACWRRALGAGTLAALLLITTYGGARAHEHRTLGDYQVEVGFDIEPTIVDEPNALHLEVFRAPAAGAASASPAADAEEPEGEPVEGLADTLQAEVSWGGQTKALTLEPNVAEPGVYTADFIPAATGAYTFHIFGTIEGTPGKERFTSGPETFDEAAARDTLAFPNTATTSAGADSDAQDTADTARTLAIIALVVGAAGLVAGGAGLAQARRTRRAGVVAHDAIDARD